MSPTSEFMAEVSLARSYPELFQVTGLLQSLVLRAEDMLLRHVMRRGGKRSKVSPREEGKGAKFLYEVH